MSAGDHIKVGRFWYTHHGIDLGNGRVVQYSGEPFRGTGRIGAVSMEEFAQGGKVLVVEHAECDPPDVVISRATSRLGEQSYSVPFNNCEHFAQWCKTGSEESGQVQGWGAALSGVAAGTVARFVFVRAAGFMIPVGGPVVAAALAGYGVYKLVRIARRGSSPTGQVRLGIAA